jgi:hypothetical protein
VLVIVGNSFGGAENAGPENDGPKYRTGKRRTFSNAIAGRRVFYYYFLNLIR